MSTWAVLCGCQLGSEVIFETSELTYSVHVWRNLEFNIKKKKTDNKINLQLKEGEYGPELFFCGLGRFNIVPMKLLFSQE